MIDVATSVLASEHVKRYGGMSPDTLDGYVTKISSLFVLGKLMQVDSASYTILQIR